MISCHIRISSHQSSIIISYHLIQFSDGSSTTVLPVHTPITTHSNISASIDGILYTGAVIRVKHDIHVFIHGTQTKYVLPVQTFSQSGMECCVHMIGVCICSLHDVACSV